MLSHPGVLAVGAEHLPGAERRRVLDPVGEEDAVEVVELVLHRPRAEAAEPLGVLGAVGVEVGHLDLGARVRRPRRSGMLRQPS